MSIDSFLEGSGIIGETLAPVSEPADCIGSIQGFASLQRIDERHEPVEQRIQDFCNVVRGMSEAAASRESLRCLQCDLRLKIKTVKGWSSY